MFVVLVIALSEDVDCIRPVRFRASQILPFGNLPGDVHHDSKRHDGTATPYGSLLVSVMGNMLANTATNYASHKLSQLLRVAREPVQQDDTHTGCAGFDLPDFLGQEIDEVASGRQDVALQRTQDALRQCALPLARAEAVTHGEVDELQQGKVLICGEHTAESALASTGGACFSCGVSLMMSWDDCDAVQLCNLV